MLGHTVYLLLFLNYFAIESVIDKRVDIIYNNELMIFHGVHTYGDDKKKNRIEDDSFDLSRNLRAYIRDTVPRDKSSNKDYWIFTMIGMQLPKCSMKESRPLRSYFGLSIRWTLSLDILVRYVALLGPKVFLQRAYFSCKYLIWLSALGFDTFN